MKFDLISNLAGTCFLCLAIGACAYVPDLPKTEGEKNSSYSYIPLDPLPIQNIPGISCTEQKKPEVLPILDALPDNSVRIAVAEYSGSGGLTFGPGQVGVSGKSYQVILDYINVDTSNVLFSVFRRNQSGEVFSFYDDIPNSKVFVNRIDDSRAKSLNTSTKDNNLDENEIVIPVYVGVGLRLTASITVLNGSVNLSSLGGIAAEAKSGNITGSLVVQTLGITGKQVATSLPLPSELNETTVQNAILSLGSIKAIMYDKENVIITPRVTGIYNPIGNSNEGLVNAIVSELARSPIPWFRRCKSDYNK